MPFSGAKTKNPAKVARINKDYYGDPTNYDKLLNSHPVLKQANQDFAVLIGAAVNATLGASRAANIKPPPPFPCTVLRWMGKLPFDNTDKAHTNDNGDKDYPYIHEKAARLNANLFRGITCDILACAKMVNDFEDLDPTVSPNPGGQVGSRSQVVPRT